MGSLGSFGIFITKLFRKINFRLQRRAVFQNHFKNGLRTKMVGLKRNYNS